jgi:hypothetical protein
MLTYYMLGVFATWVVSATVLYLDSRKGQPITFACIIAITIISLAWFVPLTALLIQGFLQDKKQ